MFKCFSIAHRYNVRVHFCVCVCAYVCAYVCACVCQAVCLGVCNLLLHWLSYTRTQTHTDKRAQPLTDSHLKPAKRPKGIFECHLHLWVQQLCASVFMCVLVCVCVYLLYCFVPGQHIYHTLCCHLRNLPFTSITMTFALLQCHIYHIASTIPVPAPRLSFRTTLAIPLIADINTLVDSTINVLHLATFARSHN